MARDKLIEVEIDDNEVSVALNQAMVGTRDLRKSFEEYHEKMVERVDRTFELAGGRGSVAKGGYDPFRDIKWEPLAPQRRNKSGKPIPAWGGTPKKRGKGKTKGKLRPSGKRVRKEDALNQDSGRYRQRITTGFVYISSDVLRFGPGLNYAGRLERYRETLTLKPSDTRLLEKILVRNILGMDEGGEE